MMAGLRWQGIGREIRRRYNLPGDDGGDSTGGCDRQGCREGYP